MRFISRHPRYSFQARALTMQVLSTPQGAIQVPAQAMILCDFEQGGLSPWEEEYALANLNFLGQPDQDAVPKTNRLSVFDTETWQLAEGADDATREFVEQRLLNNSEYGQDFVSVDERRHPAPWPAYDRVDDVGTLAEMLELLGYNSEPSQIEAIRLYEHQNQKRPEFLHWLTEREEELAPASAAPRRQEVVSA